MSFSSIFLHEKKDGAPGGRRLSRAAGKHAKLKNHHPGGRVVKNAAGKHAKLKKSQQKRTQSLRPKAAQRFTLHGNLVLFTDRRAANCHFIAATPHSGIA